MSSTTTSESGAPSANPVPVIGQDPLSQGPSVYLYGFLATLVLVFLVSIVVAYKGYRTRRVLRARIDEAIARGVLSSGYDASNPHLPLYSSSRRNPLPPKPIMHEAWISNHPTQTESDVKFTSLTALKPYTPDADVPPVHAAAHARSLSHWLDPLRQYWFVTPPEGIDANQLQGRPARTTPGNGTGTGTPAAEEKDVLEDVQQLIASVLIAMPGEPVQSRSRPSSSTAPLQPLVQEEKELPQLVLGVLEVVMEEKHLERTGDGLVAL